MLTLPLPSATTEKHNNVQELGHFSLASFSHSINGCVLELALS